MLFFMKVIGICVSLSEIYFEFLRCCQLRKIVSKIAP